MKTNLPTVITAIMLAVLAFTNYRVLRVVQTQEALIGEQSDRIRKQESYIKELQAQAWEQEQIRVKNAK